MVAAGIACLLYGSKLSWNPSKDRSASIHLEAFLLIYPII
jgi:hypothetical protein